MFTSALNFSNQFVFPNFWEVLKTTHPALSVPNSTLPPLESYISPLPHVYPSSPLGHACNCGKFPLNRFEKYKLV